LIFSVSSAGALDAPVKRRDTARIVGRTTRRANLIGLAQVDVEAPEPLEEAAE
jgi:hypothetical protein